MAEQKKYDYGIIGLGTMGRNLALNMNDHGFSVAGFDKTAAQINIFTHDTGSKEIFATSKLLDFFKVLDSPKKIIMLVPAGKPVDEVIEELLPHLAVNDILMDFGNSHFTDTNLRYEKLEKLNINYMGIGISGGESGARHGASIMPGGNKNAYDQIQHMLKAVSAKVNNEPCVQWLGPGSAGHYVKMVHNGIEYGIMQLISEAYHLLKQVGGFSNKDMYTIFSNWNEGMLNSFLIEITAAIFTRKDDLGKGYLIDKILDSAKQKGTGGWTSEDALKLQIPLPVIDIAVTMRDLSAYKKERVATHKMLSGPTIPDNCDKESLIKWLEEALYFAVIISYAQGFALLYSASKKYKYDLKLENIASIWRGGCIIRSSLLENIRKAFSKKSTLSNLINDDDIAKKLMHAQTEMRKIIQIGAENGIPMPGFMMALAYYDSYRSEWLPANLIQAQRDYFGAHTYERIDKEGIFHTHWEDKS